MINVLLPILVIVAVLLHPTTTGVTLMGAVIALSFVRIAFHFILETRMTPLLPAEVLPERKEFRDLTINPDFNKKRREDVLLSSLNLAITLSGTFYMLVMSFITFEINPVLSALVLGPICFIVVRMAFILLFSSLQKKPVFSMTIEVKESSPGEILSCDRLFGWTLKVKTNGVFYEVEHEGRIHRIFRRDRDGNPKINTGDTVIFYSMDGGNTEIVALN